MYLAVTALERVTLRGGREVHEGVWRVGCQRGNVIEPQVRAGGTTLSRLRPPRRPAELPQPISTGPLQLVFAPLSIDHVHTLRDARLVSLELSEEPPDLRQNFRQV
jgi:hypothetical protein